MECYTNASSQGKSGHYEAVSLVLLNTTDVILADKHHLEEFEELGIEAMIVRSLCGTDEYANGKRLYSTPGQLLMTFNEDGRDASYQIRV